MFYALTNVKKIKPYCKVLLVSSLWEIIPQLKYNEQVYFEITILQI